MLTEPTQFSHLPFLPFPRLAVSLTSAAPQPCQTESRGVELQPLAIKVTITALFLSTSQTKLTRMAILRKYPPTAPALGGSSLTEHCC